MKISFCICVFLSAFFVTSCREKSSSSLIVRQPILNKIQSESKLPFPAGSVVIHSFEPEVVVDPMWLAKIALPKSSYDKFKEELTRKIDDPTVLNNSITNTVIWWKPSEVVLMKQYLADQQTFVRVFVSKENGDFFVYMECIVF